MLLHYVYTHIFLLLPTTIVAICVQSLSLSLTRSNIHAYTKCTCLHATATHRKTRNSIKKSRPTVKTNFQVAATTAYQHLPPMIPQWRINFLPLQNSPLNTNCLSRRSRTATTPLPRQSQYTISHTNVQLSMQLPDYYTCRCSTR